MGSSIVDMRPQYYLRHLELKEHIEWIDLTYITFIKLPGKYASLSELK